MFVVRKSLSEEAAENYRADRRFYRIALVLVCLLITVIYFNLCVLINITVIGSSMEKTLIDGEIVLVDKTDNNVKPGDVVIIKDVRSFWLIKRVIAVNKCTVEIKEDGFVYVDGEKLVEDYVGGAPTPVHAYGYNGYRKWELNDGDIFYLGDNRRVSADSREMGACRKENILGTVFDISIRHKKFFTAYLRFVQNNFYGKEYSGN